MLRPTKHSHPDRTVVNVALLLLMRIRKRRLEGYGALRGYAKKAVAGGDVLFLLGLIEYRPKTDAIEYVGPNEAV